MFYQLARGRQQRARLKMRVRAAAPFVTAGVVYTLLLAASTAHMSVAERESALLMRWGLDVPMLHLTVRLARRECVFDEAFVGDGLLRVGSQCVLQKGATNRERKTN